MKYTRKEIPKSKISFSTRESTLEAPLEDVGALLWGQASLSHEMFTSAVSHQFPAFICSLGKEDAQVAARQPPTGPPSLLALL